MGCTPTGAGPRAGWTRGTDTPSGSAAAGASWPSAPDTVSKYGIIQCSRLYQIKIINYIGTDFLLSTPVSNPCYYCKVIFNAMSNIVSYSLLLLIKRIDWDRKNYGILKNNHIQFRYINTVFLRILLNKILGQRIVQAYIY